MNSKTARSEPSRLPRSRRLSAGRRVEGWNPGLDDAGGVSTLRTRRASSARSSTGELVAGISAVAYGDDFGFIGLYICRPDMRGKGHGKAGLGRRHGAALGQRTIGLDGVRDSRRTTARWASCRYRRNVSRASGTSPGARHVRCSGSDRPQPRSLPCRRNWFHRPRRPRRFRCRLTTAEIRASGGAWRAAQLRVLSPAGSRVVRPPTSGVPVPGVRNEGLCNARSGRGRPGARRADSKWRCCGAAVQARQRGLSGKPVRGDHPVQAEGSEQGCRLGLRPFRDAAPQPDGAVGGEIAWNAGGNARPDGEIGRKCSADESLESAACWLWTAMSTAWPTPAPACSATPTWRRRRLSCSATSAGRLRRIRPLRPPSGSRRLRCVHPDWMRVLNRCHVERRRMRRAATLHGPADNSDAARHRRTTSAQTGPRTGSQCDFGSDTWN